MAGMAAQIGSISTTMGKGVTHYVMFSQRSGSDLRWVEFRLDGDNDNVANPKKVGPLRWRQGTASDDSIDLYPNFTAEDKARLQWRWDSSQHGGLIEIGVDTPYRTVKGRTVESYFTVWFSLRGAKRLASGQFRVEGYDPKGNNYTDREGVGVYELGGSSNTFQKGEGQWQVSQYGGG
jgi:hypothetical protein